MYWLAIAFLASVLVLIPLWLFDPTELLGVSVWEKPLKFFISAAIFTFTYSWISAHLSRWPRLIKWTGNIIGISLLIELIAITGAAAFGVTSHFNISTPMGTFVWAVMATFVNIILISTVVMSVLILLERRQPFLLKLGLGLGSFISAVGMGIAFLMTEPTPDQLSNFQGIAGAHSVGVADGGPGLPLLGWSTVAGDLRVGHFFGLHAIQIAIALLMIQRYLPKQFRFPLILAGNLSYLGFVLIVTAQALRAESVISPSPQTLLQLGVLAITSLVVFILLSSIGKLRLNQSKNPELDDSQKQVV
jgi:hypothetical protein